MSQILAVRSNEPVTILSLTNNKIKEVPVWNVEGEGVNHVFVVVQGVEFGTGQSVPYFAGSIIASRNESSR